MKTKIIVASSLGLLGITSMVIGATTFASTTGADKTGRNGSGAKMMGNRGGMMKLFANTGDAQAFKTAMENAIANKDFAAFQAVHTKYGITMNITQDQFNEMIAAKTEMDTLHKNINEAIKNGDYATWKKLNADKPIVSKIDTEAKFKKLQEMETYKEKMETLRTELGLKGPQGEGMGMGEGVDFGMGKRQGHMENKGGMMREGDKMMNTHGTNQ